jgi:DNA-binding XRE family transcriptional regulator
MQDEKFNSTDISKYRKKYKLSREQMAADLGVSYQTIFRWEKKNNEMKVTTSLALQKYFEKQEQKRGN